MAQGRPPIRMARLGAVTLSAASIGCGMVPRSRLEDCVQQLQVARSENQQLKATNATQQGRIRDLTERGIDDARRVQAMEDRSREADRVNVSLQEEVDAMSAAVEQMKRQIHQVADTSPPDPPTGRPHRR